MLKYAAGPIKPQHQDIIPPLNWRGGFKRCLHERRIKLTGHILRAHNCDPMRQVLEGTVPSHTPRPRKNWLVTSLGFCCTKTTEHLWTPSTNANEQQQQILLDARNWVFRLVHASHCPATVRAVAIAIIRYLQFNCLRGYPIPFHQFLRVFLWCSWLLFPCFTLPSVWILSEVPNGPLSRDGLTRLLSI
jgi:hypothetical protein